MRLAVLGASGRTGRLVLDNAVDRGDDVIALCRKPQTITVVSDHIQPRRVDVLDRTAVIESLDGCDAVVSALGVGTSRQPTTTYSSGIAHVLDAMQIHHIRRLSVISAAPLAPRAQLPAVSRWLVRPILNQVFGSTYRDMREMEARLAGSDLDWICLRPPRLVDRPATGAYRVSVAARLAHSARLTYGDLAVALLDGLDRADLYRKPALIAN